MKIEFTITKYNFTIPQGSGTSVNRSYRMFKLLYQVFGIERSEISVFKDLKIRCGSEDFARFLYTRNEYGMQNGFKDLNMKILDDQGKVQSNFIDTTT